MSTYRTLFEGIERRARERGLTTPGFGSFVLLRASRPRRLTTVEAECDTLDVAIDE